MANHGYGPSSRARGFVRIEGEGDKVWYLRLCEHTALMKALDAGDAWFRGTDNFGTQLRLRLDVVQSVETRTPESVAAGLAELDAKANEDRREAMFGDDDASSAGRTG